MVKKIAQRSREPQKCRTCSNVKEKTKLSPPATKCVIVTFPPCPCCMSIAPMPYLPFYIPFHQHRDNIHLLLTTCNIRCSFVVGYHNRFLVHLIPSIIVVSIDTITEGEGSAPCSLLEHIGRCIVEACSYCACGTAMDGSL